MRSDGTHILKLPPSTFLAVLPGSKTARLYIGTERFWKMYFDSGVAVFLSITRTDAKYLSKASVFHISQSSRSSMRSCLPRYTHWRVRSNHSGDEPSDTVALVGSS